MSEKKSIISGFSNRISEQFALSMQRYVSDGYDKHVLWRFGIGQYCGMQSAAIQCDATLPMLIETKTFIEKAIETLRTDGCRSQTEDEQS